MIALLICGIGILAAVKVSQSAVRSSARSSQTTDIGARARIISRQLRTDLRLAGEGSTGAIGAWTGNEPWATIIPNYVSLAPSSRMAIPAVSGANNIASSLSIAGFKTMPYPTDAIMIVVPDPSTRTQFDYATPQNSTTFAVANDPTHGLGCPNGMVYISDHASSNGAGRTQIANVQPQPGGIVTVGAVTTVNLRDQLVFDVTAGAEIMCARVSTYFVGLPVSLQPNGTVPWLMRSDLQALTKPTLLPGASGAAYLGNATIAVGDLDAPGVYDLQVAYSLSSVFLNRTTPVNMRWAFNGQSGSPDPTTIAASKAGWFEVRQVRFNMLFGSVRAVANSGTLTSVPEPPAEDGAPIPMPIDRGRYRVTAGELLTSIRFFDKAVPSGVNADPW